MKTFEEKYLDTKGLFEIILKNLEEQKPLLERIKVVLPDLDWSTVYIQSPTFPICKKDLPKLRKEFGKIKIAMKQAKSENELEINVRCENLPSDWWFKYIIPYHNKEGKRCRIQKVVNTNERWALVCK